MGAHCFPIHNERGELLVTFDQWATGFSWLSEQLGLHVPDALLQRKRGESVQASACPDSVRCPFNPMHQPVATIPALFCIQQFPPGPCSLLLDMLNASPKEEIAPNHRVLKRPQVIRDNRPSYRTTAYRPPPPPPPGEPPRASGSQRSQDIVRTLSPPSRALALQSSGIRQLTRARGQASRTVIGRPPGLGAGGRPGPADVSQQVAPARPRASVEARGGRSVVLLQMTHESAARLRPCVPCRFPVGQEGETDSEPHRERTCRERMKATARRRQLPAI